jgi:hypothetical protein
MQNKRINTNFVPAELIDGDSLNRRFLLNSWGIEPQLFKAELIFRLIITRQIKMFTKVLFKIKTTVNFFQDDTKGHPTRGTASAGGWLKWLSPE